MLQGNNTEQSDPGNRSVGGFSVIDSAKRILEKFCPRTVSCADIIALAAGDAVEIVSSTSLHGWHCSMAYWQDTSFGTVINLKGTWEQAGEPRTMIPTGRRDGMVSVASNVRPNKRWTWWRSSRKREIWDTCVLKYKEKKIPVVSIPLNC